MNLTPATLAMIGFLAGVYLPLAPAPTLVAALGAGFSTVWGARSRIAVRIPLFALSLGALAGLMTAWTVRPADDQFQLEYVAVRIDNVYATRSGGYFYRASILEADPPADLGALRCATFFGGTLEAGQTVWFRQAVLKADSPACWRIAYDKMLRLDPPPRPDGARERIAQAIRQRFDQPTRGLLLALSTGQRDELTRDLRDTMQGTGLAHLLSISGLHIVIAFVIGGWLARLLVLAFPGALTGFWALAMQHAGGLALASAYVVLSGFAAPAQRSLIMLLVWVATAWVGPYRDGLHALALAAWATVILNPAAMYDLGWQMSFAAVAMLIAGSRVLPVWAQRRPLLRLAAMSAFATVAVIPPALSRGMDISPMGVLTNLWSVPFADIVLLPGLSLMVAFALAIGHIPYWLADLFDYLNTLWLTSVEPFSGVGMIPAERLAWAADWLTALLTTAWVAMLWAGGSKRTNTPHS